MDYKYYYSIKVNSSEELLAGVLQALEDIREGVTESARFDNGYNARSEVRAEFIALDLGRGGGRSAPQIPGYVCVQGRGTSGGGHQCYWYLPMGASLETLMAFLEGHPPSSLFKIEKRAAGRVVITATSIGRWIGRGGMWAKAYQTLGVKVEFVGLDEVAFGAIRSNKYERVVRPTEEQASELLRMSVVVSRDDRWGSTEWVVGLKKGDLARIMR